MQNTQEMYDRITALTVMIEDAKSKRDISIAAARAECRKAVVLANHEIREIKKHLKALENEKGVD